MSHRRPLACAGVKLDGLPVEYFILTVFYDVIVTTVLLHTLGEGGKHPREHLDW